MNVNVQLILEAAETIDSTDFGRSRVLRRAANALGVEPGGNGSGWLNDIWDDAFEAGKRSAVAGILTATMYGSQQWKIDNRKDTDQ